MKKEIIINSTNEDTRIAILEDKRLVEIFVERPDNERMVGDIYKGKVKKIITGMQAAFVDIGHDQDAFLHFSDFGTVDTEMFIDVDDEEENENGKKTNDKRNQGSKKGPTDEEIASILRKNKEITVQIVKEPISNKGPRVTNEVSLPGRFLVLVPNENRIGISRKISDRNERRRLKKIAKSILPDNYGLIVRTVAEGKSDRTIKSDLKKQLAQWKTIEKQIEKLPSPICIFKDMGMASSIIRDFFTNDVEHVIVDSRKLYKDISTYLKDVAPNLLNKLEYFKSKEPIFDAFKIEDEIQKSISRKVWLKNGGYLFIEQTEALVSIDVNSGKYFGKKDHEEHSKKINMEAAREISRQIRLRDLGGLLVIDFIDMMDEDNKARIVQELKKEFSKDRATTKIADMSPFGLIEMTRQRIRPSLIQNISEACAYCGGTGLVLTKGTVVAKIERWIRRYKTGDYDRRLIVRIHPDMYEYFSNGRISRRMKLMWKYWMKIELEGDDRLKIHEFEVLAKKNRENLTKKFI